MVSFLRTPPQLASRGHPERADSLLLGHELAIAALEYDNPTLQATYADIPDDMSPAEFVYRDVAGRRNLPYGQRAIVGGLLQQLYEEESKEEGHENPEDRAREKRKR